ncbi:hypothetical protein BH09ACT7_BH09ACT7_16160 [soil metagenome]
MKRISQFATTVAVCAGLSLAGLGLTAGTAQAYTYGPFQWCPGQPLPNDPPRPDGSLVWDMSVCHTYWFDWDVRTKAPAQYWEGENLYPTPIPRRSRSRRTALRGRPSLHPRGAGGSRSCSARPYESAPRSMTFPRNRTLA